MKDRSVDSGTRRRILEILKYGGPQTASTMAEELGISAMAVRQHLYNLADGGLVDAITEPEGVGRPSKRWRLTDGADAFFPHGYAELTAGLLASIRDTFGDEGMDKIVRTRTRSQIAAYQARMSGVKSVPKRLAKLAEIRTEEGYMAGVNKVQDGYLFTENHCPICEAAKTCTGLCAAELDLFRAVLGDGVSVERSEHIITGARRCAYIVKSADPR